MANVSATTPITPAKHIIPSFIFVILGICQIRCWISKNRVGKRSPCFQNSRKNQTNSSFATQGSECQGTRDATGQMLQKHRVGAQDFGVKSWKIISQSKNIRSYAVSGQKNITSSLLNVMENSSFKNYLGYRYRATKYFYCQLEPFKKMTYVDR